MRRWCNATWETEQIRDQNCLPSGCNDTLLPLLVGIQNCQGCCGTISSATSCNHVINAQRPTAKSPDQPTVIAPRIIHDTFPISRKTRMTHDGKQTFFLHRLARSTPWHQKVMSVVLVIALDAWWSVKSWSINFSWKSHCTHLEASSCRQSSWQCAPANFFYAIIADFPLEFPK